MSDEPLRFYGIYRGTVHSTADPTRQGRLQVKVMSVNGEGALDWALPCFPMLTQQPDLEAKTSGAHTVAHTVVGRTKKITLRLPQRGDPVWVMFENGDVGKPVWLGTWRGV